MRLVLILLLVFVGAGAGLFAGITLKPAPEECPPEEHCDGHGAEAAKDPHDKADASGFAALNRQFVVPILREGRVASLIVCSLAIEVPEAATQAVFAAEPKLRDAFLEVLFVHASTGGFDGDFTARQSMADLKDLLKQAAAPIVGPDLRDVLITEIVRQDL